MWRIHQIFKQLCLLLPLLYSIPAKIDGQTVAAQSAAAGSPLISGQRAHQQSVVAMPLPAEDNFEEIFAKNFGAPPPAAEGENHRQQDVLETLANGGEEGNEPQEEAEHVHGFDKIDAGVEAAITSTRPPTLMTHRPQQQQQKIVALEIENGTMATASALLDVPPPQFDEKQSPKKPPPQPAAPSSLPPAPSSSTAPALENAIPEFPPSAETIQQPLCPISAQMPTFLRHQWLFGGQQPSGAAGGGGGGGTAHAANFVRKMDSLEACARLCRENVEPFGGRHFGCHGFTYLSHKNAKNNICEFFDDHLAAALEKKPPIGSGIQKGGQGHLAPGAGSELPSSSSPRNYFERICLPLSSRCSRFPFSFEVYPRRSFVGVEPIQSEEVDDRERCLEFCLQNERCRSVDFDTENLTCHLYAQTQHWTLGANDDKGLVENLAESVDLDHYENTCLLDLDRCGSRHLAFVLIRNAELAGFSVALGNLSASLCLTRCLDSPPAFCRSVQFRPQTSECLLGTDRPHSPIPSDDMDIFEPICLPDPPSTSTLECLGEHVFERIPSMELRAEGGGGEGQGKVAAAVNEGTDIPGLALEECLDACILDETCQSLNYRAASTAEEEESDVQALCRLFPFNRADNRTLPVLIQNVDYYEMACSRIFFTTNPANRTHQTETTITTKLPPPPSRKEKEEKKGGGKQQQQKENKDQRIALESVVASVDAKGGNGRQENGNNAGQSAGIPENDPRENLQQTTKADAAILAAGGGNQNCTASKLGILLEAGRVLRIEHRIQHHVNVRNLEQCQRICIQAKAFHCATFAYSQKSRDCILSSIVLSNGLINSPEYGTTITQKNPNFDLYMVREELKCVEAETVKTTPKILTTLTTILTTKTTTSTARTTARNDERIELENEKFGGEIGRKTDRIEPPNPSNPQFTEDPNPPVVFTEGASIFNENIIRSTLASTSTTIRQKVEETTTRTTEESKIERTRPTTELPLSKQPSHAKESEEEPFQTQKANNINAGIGSIGGGVGGRLSPHQVHAAAFCDSQGVNVTFRLIDGTRYSGAVYAADRFTQCRLFVEQQSQFAFFVNRPNRHLQNWCNAQEIDGQLSVMLVLSNDQGVPLEITTKDDLFFYISCNYGAGEASPFRDGIVVSGLGIGADLGRLQQQVAQMEQQNQQIQQQQQMMEKRRGEDKRVKLKIVRNGMPVSNVYIGEKLVAIVESNNLNAGTFRVAECNATRVPPASDKLPPINLLLNANKSPNSIPLLDHRGCSLLPEIMGSMRRVGDHMEAPLTAFRIDGSNELDIICSVIICRVHCVQQPEQCERPTARFGRMSGKQLLAAANSDSLDDEGDKITVDQRIRVLVMKDEEEADERQQSAAAGQPTLTIGNKKGGQQQQQLNEQQKKRLDLTKAIFDEQREEEEVEDEGGRLLEGNPTLGGGSFKASNGDICLNPLLILLMVMLFVLAITALFVSLLTHWCRRKNARTNFYPTSTELSSHHFHIPRILDRAYMG